MHRRLNRAYPIISASKTVKGGKDLRDNLKNLKPSTEFREKLATILRYPPSEPLTEEDGRLLWIYRYYLKQDKKVYCTPFIHLYILWLTDNLQRR
jgi:hypothetical protein